jgi:Protein of unknown function (DUF732)
MPSLGPRGEEESGHSACFLLKFGSTPDKLADRMMTTGLGPDQAHQFVALSVHDYCPQYNDEGSVCVGSGVVCAAGRRSSLPPAPR